MNRLLKILALLGWILLAGQLVTAQEREREEGIPEGATEPEHLKMRYEGNDRQRTVFEPAPVKPTTMQELNQAMARRKQMAEASIFKHYPVRSIGPNVMSGRVTDLAVNEQNSKIFYVGYASGGVFKTVNNGNTFESVFDHQRALGIGDIALAPSDPTILWVGTGESNSSRSSYAGAGVYKSTDAGKTWQFTGLDFTQHIGRIVIHPQRPEVVWVAAIGALYSTNRDRGLYKTTDGGNTWKQTLFLNDSTGVIDLVINPQNPDQLWAATWQRLRNPGNFVGNGTGSAIYVSNDGGETWQPSMNGFPKGGLVGRIGLDICLSKPSVLYAVVDNQEAIRKEKKKEADQDKKDQKKTRLKREDFRNMDARTLMDLSDAELDTFLRNNNFPKKYNARVVKGEIQREKYQPKALYDYFGEDNDANTNLFETSIKGAEVYRSDDYGATWRKVNSKVLDGLYYTYGYYFGQIKVTPDNPERVFTWGVPLVVSNDGGKTFTLTDTSGRVHGDHHAMWIDPKDGEHIIDGNDGGVNLSYDGGKTWMHLNHPNVGQFYTVMVDMETPYHVYGGLQDNGVYYGSSQTKPNEGKDWEPLMGGDGMFVAVDPRDRHVIYTGFQYGNYFKLRPGKAKPEMITPRHDLGEPALRWNWRTPLIMSLHNPDIIYIGSQRLHRSMDGATTWQTISPDLTKNKKQGNVPFSTLTVIAESPLKFGTIYTGADDGNLHLTRDGGASWQSVSAGLPPDLWISSICPSRHDEGTVYVTLTGYRYDDFHAYVYKSTDFGKTWTSLKGNLPDESTNVVVEDPVNPALLYLGTDHGTYISLNGGGQWELVANALPNVANYDMMVHPRENELVIATHGRSMYVMDVKPLQGMSGGKENAALVAFEPPPVKYNKEWGKQEYSFVPLVAPGVRLLYYQAQGGNPVSVEIADPTGRVIRKLTGNAEPGFQEVHWDLKGSGPAVKGKTDKNKNHADVFVKPGTYSVTFGQGKNKASTQVVVR